VSQEGIIEPVTIIKAPSAVTLVSPESSPNTVKQPIFKVDGVFAGQTVRIFSDSNCQTEMGSQISNSTSVSINSNILNFGTHTIYSNVTNADGNSSPCSTSFVTYQLRSNPSLSDLRDKIIDEDDEIIIPFTALDEDDPGLGCSSVRVTSSNPSLLPLSSIFITGSGTSCSLKLIPLKDQFGEASVTILTKDETTEVTKSLKLTVNSVPDAPMIVLSKLALTFLEDAPSEQIILTISDPDPETIMNCSQISFIPSSIVDVAVSGSAPSCVATITPKLYQSGLTKILFTVNNGLSASETLGITIIPVPNLPQITLSKNSLTMIEDQSSEIISVKVFDPDSSISCSQLSLSSSTLVSSVSGGSAPNCTLRFTPKLNQHGSENLSVIFKNDLEVIAPFSLKVTPVDDAPVLNLSKNSLSFTEDDEAAPLVITLSDVDSDVSCSQVSVSGDTAFLDPLSIPSTSSPCNLSLRPKGDTFGTNKKITFTVENEKSDSKDLSFSISEVDDAPTISLKSSSLSFKEDESEKFVTVTISDKDSEINCSKLSVISSKDLVNLGTPSPLSGGTTSSVECSVSVTPKRDVAGKSDLTFTVDTGLTASAEMSISITEEDDAPTISVSSTSLTFSYNGEPQTVTVYYNDIDSPVDCGTEIVRSSSNLVSTSQLNCGDPFDKSIPRSIDVKISPKLNKVGEENLSFKIQSGGLTSTATLKITIVPGIPLLSYSPASGKIGEAITITATIDNRGSAIQECKSVSALPAGLNINSSCVISGTPTVIGTGTYTISIKNEIGTSTANVTITVNAGLPVISIAPFSVIGTVGTAFSVTPIVTSNGATTTCSISAGGPLPDGLTLTPSTCVISGTPTTIKTATTYTLTATNSVGSGTANVAITISKGSCTSLGYDGPATAVSSLTSCYFDCASRNLCGPNVYYPSTVSSCSKKVSAPSTQTCTTSQTCSQGILGYNTSGACSKRLAHVTVQGTQLTSSSAGSAICSNTFGPGFVWLDFHTGGDWYGISSEWLNNDVPSKRGFVWISDQAANCYNSSGNLQLTFGVHSGGAGYWSGPGSPTSKDAYLGDTSCSESRPLICYNPSWCGNVAVNGYSCTQSTSCTTQNENVCSNGLPVLSYQNTTTSIGSSTTIIPTLNHNGSTISSCTITAGGALPSGLTINTNNCVISGLPSTTKTARTYTVTATNASGSSTAQVTITVNQGAPAVSFTPSSVSGTVGNALSITPSIANNGATTSCSITAGGALPDGLTLTASNCIIAGTPTAVRPATTYTVTATNSAGSRSANVTITVNAGLPIVTYAPKSGVIGVAMSIPAVVNNRGAAVTCSASSLPTGLNIIPSTCEISGTPTALVSGTYTVSASNSAGSTTTQVSISITANSPLLSYTSQTSGVSNSSIQGQVGTLLGPISPTVLDGRGSEVSCSSANLPAGLSVDRTTCRISGTPNAEFYGSPTITATNSVGQTTATLSISIIPGRPVLSYSGSLTGTTGQSVSITPTLNTKGGSLTGCTASPPLPSNLKVDPTNCRVYGNSNIAVKGTYTITATNAGGSGSANLSIGIQLPNYDCIANGYTGPSGTVTSVSSCYTDCAKINKCGGIKNYPNTCYEKTAIKNGESCVDVEVSYTWKQVKIENNCWGMGGGHDFYVEYRFEIIEYDANNCAYLYTECNGNWGNPPPSWCVPGYVEPYPRFYYSWERIGIYDRICEPTYDYVCQ
jgi:hypothetical protein